MSSLAKIQANRENSLLSTGPITPEGKAKSSLNAVKTGLTGRTVLLPSDDVEAYQNHVAGFFKQFQPVGDQEHTLVQSLADTEWRLLRIPALEQGIYALGRLELATEFSSEPDPSVRAALIEAKVFRTNRRDLSNLSLQEGRLRRQREQDRAELKQLQSDRQRTRKQQLDRVARYYLDSVDQDWDFPGGVEQFGFEFTLTKF